MTTMTSGNRLWLKEMKERNERLKFFTFPRRENIHQKHIVISNPLELRYQVRWVMKGADSISPECEVRGNTGIIFC